MLNIDVERVRATLREGFCGCKEIATLIRLTARHSSDDNVTPLLGDFSLCRGQYSKMVMSLGSGLQCLDTILCLAPSVFGVPVVCHAPFLLSLCP